MQAVELKAAQLATLKHKVGARPALSGLPVLDSTLQLNNVIALQSLTCHDVCCCCCCQILNATRQNTPENAELPLKHFQL